MGSVMAEDSNGVDLNQTSVDGSSDLNQYYSNQNLLKSSSEDSMVDESSDEIVVEDWGELQYYSSLKDKNYVLKLKENTNYYPNDPTDSSNQVLFNNNVTIIGAPGAYIGDASSDARNITYTAMKVPDNNGVGITLKNVLFKWIATSYQPDGVFLQMCGNSVNYFEDCYFTNISTYLGHSSILHIKTGDAIITNCTFINCTTDFGCLSVYNPDDDPTKTCVLARMNVSDSYFEGNYARTEPGCINNCGILVVNNSTFYKNSAFWWAGAIHTHGGANTTIYDSDFIDNLAGWNGGALYTYSYLQIYNSRFIGNNCTTNNGGGAIGACKYLHAPYIHIEDSLFEDNENLCWGLDELSTSGTGRGGAISFMDEGGLEVYNTTFIKNSASIGTAICAINGGLSHGSPDVRIIGNRFINHTRVGDVLDVRVATGSIAEVRDNYFENNSIVFSKLKLSAEDPDSAGRVTMQLDAALKNPASYDADILDKSSYDVYVDGAYRTTVNSRTFTLDLGKGNTARVYVVPSISNSKSNEVFAGKVREYIYVSQQNGNDNNDGSTRAKALKTLNKSIELARATENIIIMDGTFTETNLLIDYNLTITAENGASIKVTGNAFTITNGDVSFENLLFKDCKYGSSTKTRLINQTSSGFLILTGCTFENNEYKAHIEADGKVEAENLKVTNCKDGSFIRANSISIKSSIFSNNIVTYSLYKSILMYKTQTAKFVAENLTFTDNTVYSGCIGVKKAKSTITECSFIGNEVYSGRSSGIYMEDSSNLLVESCMFINNIDTGKYASVIYIGSGTLVIRDSILINNSYENDNHVVINGGETHLKKLQASNNWWGNTPDNLTKPALKVYPKSNQLPNGWDPATYWLVLNVTSISNEIELNKQVPVQFMFTQIDNDGNITIYDGLKLPSFDLELTGVNGTCTDSKITVENGMATTYFTLTQISNSSLTGTFNGISSTINFQFIKSIPDMNISTEDIFVGSNADITVNLESGASGRVILRVGNTTKSQTITNSKATFSIPNLPAGNYIVEANYTGNDRFESIIKTANLGVNKHNSTTVLSHGSIEVDRDVTFTITVSNGATGTVDMYVNGEKKTTINVGQTYTIPNILRGDYVVRALYSGDSYYLASEDEFTFEVGKFVPSMTVTAPDITYGSDTIVNVNLNSTATGSVTVTIDGKTNTSQLSSGKATVSISGINAGSNKLIKVDYSGDHNYKNATATKTYNVAKASLDFTINAANIKLGQDATVSVQLPPRCGGTLTVTGIRTETKNIPLTGLVTLTYSDLALGTYTVTARYDGDNYQTTSKSATFEVSAWDNPQWPNEGYDVKNTQKSPYSSEANGNVKWVKDIDASIIGNMAIDSAGRVYVTTSNGIYSINPNDGTTNWIFNSNDAGISFSGIAIGRDTVLAPKANDKLYFINQTTGEQYHNNIYQGSSVFAPIVDGNGNIYTSGEYYGYEPTKLVVIPYKIWQTSAAPVEIEIGDYNITSSPVLVDNDTVVLITQTNLMGIKVSSQQIIFAIPIAGDSNPVVGYGNVIYVISNGHVVGYNVQGTKMCDVKITGTAGNHLSVGVNGEIFAINHEGKLFEYSTGDEALIYDLKEPISSRLLVGQDEKLYVGSDSGMFYSIDVEGNLLWKVNLNQSVSGTPVMDSNGVIYTVSGNRIAAIDKASLKDSKLSADIKNVTYGEDVIVNIDLDSQATGKVSIKIGDLYADEVIADGEGISFTVPNLAGGFYTADITYSGDARFKSKTINVKFSVGKIDTSMNVEVKNIDAGEVLQINITNLPNDAKGTVSVTIGGKSNSTNVVGNKVKLSIYGLAKGEYDATITYSGDTNYNGKTITKHVSVGYVPASFKAFSNNVNVGQDVEIMVTGLPNDANGWVHVNHGGKDYSDRVNNGNAKITIPGLANGRYDFEVVYADDTKYGADSQSVHVIVSKITPTFTANVNDINVGDDLVVDVSGLPSDATGLIIVDINSLSKNSSVGNGIAKITIPQRLANGSYSVNVTYSGDEKYNGISEIKNVKISKITLNNFTVSINDINVGDDLNVDVSGLPNDAKGKINVLINGFSNSSDVKYGSANVVIHQRLANGTYPVEIAYSGDDRYNPLKEFKSVNITKITPEMVVSVNDDNINVDEDLIIDVTGLPKDTTVNYIDILGDLKDKGLINQGTSKIVISNLTYGTYSFYVYFMGDDRYNAVKSDAIIISVNKIPSKMRVTANNIDIGEDLVIQIKLPSDVTGEFVQVSINDNDTVLIEVNGGSAVYTVAGLTKSTYNYTVTYEGNDKYDSDEYSSFVDVGKENVEYDVSIEDISYGQSAIADISNLPDDATGTVMVIVDKKQLYLSKVSKGRASISIPGLDAGEHEAEVRFSDVKYSANSKYVSFKVEKATPQITILADDIKVDEDLKIKVILPKDATGNVVVTVGNDSKTFNLIDGVGECSFSDLSAGIQIIKVNYNSNNKNYNSSSASKVIKVSTCDPEITIEADDITYGEDLIVKVNLPKDATGSVVVTADDKSKTVEIDRGIAIANISSLNAGNKSIHVSYAGDSKYSSINGSKVITVNKKSPSISISADNIKYGESLKVKVEISDNISGDIIVSCGEISKTVKAKNGLVSTEISGLTAGSQIITAKFNGNFNYGEASQLKTISVSKVIPNISVDANDIKYGETLNVKVNLPRDATGNVVISVDGISKTTAVKDGIANAEISGLTAGSKTVNVKYEGDGNYYSTSQTKQITVSKADTPIIIQADDIKTGENLIVTVNLNKDATGNVIVLVDDVSQVGKIVNGSATVEVSSLTSGVKQINVRYDGDDNYNPASSSKNITVNETNPLIKIPIDVKIVDNARVDVCMINVTGNVSVIVDGKETRVALDKDGRASVDLNNLVGGDHSVIVVFDGDDAYAPSHAVSSFKTGIATEFDQITVNDDLSISIVLTDEFGNVIANAPVSYEIKGVLMTKNTDLKGLFTIESKNGDVINVKYGGNATFDGTSMTLTLNIKDIPSIVKVASRFNIPGNAITINGYAVDVNAGEEGIYYSTKLLDDKGNPLKGRDIQFAVNNKIYDRTTHDDGSFDPYKLNMVRAGRYTMAFYYKGDDGHLSTFACVCVDLAKKPITIKASAKSYKVSAKKKYTLTLSTIAGSSHDGKVYLSPKKVTLTVNGKTYSGTTNKNGKVTFNLKLTKKGKYTAEINYEGDNTYESASKSVKLTIK